VFFKIDIYKMVNEKNCLCMQQKLALTLLVRCKESYCDQVR